MLDHVKKIMQNSFETTNFASQLEYSKSTFNQLSSINSKIMITRVQEKLIKIT